MSHDWMKKEIRVVYPFTRAADRQPNNIRQVVKVQRNIEARVKKDGLTDEYNAEMTRMVDSGAVRKLGAEEMAEYKGGIHYMPHFPVVNPESSSTKVRIVVDSKFVNDGLDFWCNKRFKLIL